MKNKKLLFIIAGAVVVIIALIAVAKMRGKKALYEVTVDTVKIGQIIETVSASGKVQPEVDVMISPDVSGEIIELNVKEGQEVQKGDLLLKINPDIYLAAVDRVGASLNTSKANLANSKARLAQSKAQFIQTEASFKRNEKLYKSNAISQAEYETAVSSYEVAKAEIEAAEQSVEASLYNVKSAQATLKEANDNLNRTTIYAPQSGTISQLNVEQGERVVGTAQMAGTEIMRIADLTNMEVNVEVNESDIVRVSLGDKAFIEVDAYLERKFEGRVTEIANSANTAGITTDQVTTFEVKVRILRSSYQDLIDSENDHLSPFRPGMSGNVDIETDLVNDVLSIPIQAVTTREDTVETDSDETKDDKRIEVVFVYEEGMAKMRKVKTGIQDSRNIQIISGLEEGLEVITGPYSILSKRLEDDALVEKESDSDSGHGPPRGDEDD